MARKRTESLESVISAFQDYDLNANGAVAALARPPRSLVERTVSPLTIGGVRQSMITLVQTSLGGGVLTLAYAMRIAGLGLGLSMLVATALVAFVGMDIMMRGAVKLRTFDTASLLACCVGPWSRPAMDVLLVLYGNGALIAYFVLLGDFVPAIVMDFGAQEWLPAVFRSPGVLRQWCILSTLVVVVPLCMPKKLSSLRYASPVALLAILVTAAMILAKAPASHAATEEVDTGGVMWAAVDWSLLKAFGILLFAFNCHLNVIPVAAELEDPSDARIVKVSLRVVVVELVFYGLISVGGYLSFLGTTAPNILLNYGASAVVTTCRVLLSCTLLVAIPTNVVPTVRSGQGLLEVCARACRASREAEEPLLDLQPTSPHGGDASRLLVTAIFLCVDVIAAILVPNVADVMGFIGATAGTLLMMVLPLLVLFKATPETYSPARVAFAAVLLVCATLAALGDVVVTTLEQLGGLPS
mmetsp:Transcript_103121/g.291605  ORF Transcript_103121/g.291605 Transcript_103121/m.291605 type:complete len:471 (-) Transcript_103121:134-1546(-)|eukprot:CAMPEP_0168399240 /NCGR_PEP_ID=MMETSP0228-20121227/21987_1 /TAXON_ID=133427 /ORGANISM="Protoceratium reticulatum, Strain CCCM 535 (=CCMP 1889)" /LENGTH=470 /DNA_ID=CAMNT_0008412757 /DNA_START=33 /DNA_END=1445 /DNA_ORIENTATION=+